MARRVFFSYHFQKDAWRANQVRNSWVTEPNQEAAGFFDAAEQEEVKRDSDDAIKGWIDDQLHGTSVTAVLIGEETADRDYVQYEIEKSFKRGNALLGIRIHDLKNREGSEGWDGRNPLKDYVARSESGKRQLAKVFPTYDWRYDDGRENIGDWVEEAVEANEAFPMRTRDSLERKEERPLETAIGVGVVGAAWYYREEIADFVSEIVRQGQFK